MMQTICIIFVFLLSVGTAAFAQGEIAGKDCERRSGVLEVGSGSTKIYAARIDFCKKKLVEVLIDKRTAVPFNEFLEKSKAGTLDAEALQMGVQKITPLMQELQSLSLDSIQGIATSAFRVAKNGKKFANDLGKKLGVAIRVISQKQEAILGYESVRYRLGVDGNSSSVIVWDIGGGSMQMVHQDMATKHFDLFEGNMASVSFKNDILRQVKIVDIQKVNSPNPIHPYELAVLQLSKNHARLNLPNWVRRKSAQARWIGIGGVLSGSVQKQSKAGEKYFDRDSLQAAFFAAAKKSDADIQSDYRITDVSNLALVLGYMDVLNIKKIETLSSSLGEGLLMGSGI